MKTITVLLVLSLSTVSAYAMKPCEELKTEIAAKLDAKGVKSYTLEIVSTKEIKDQKVVGSCDGGTNKITYQRGVVSPTTAKPVAE